MRLLEYSDEHTRSRFYSLRQSKPLHRRSVRAELVHRFRQHAIQRLKSLLNILLLGEGLFLCGCP